MYSPLIIDSEYLYETVNVETQQKNPSSLLWWMKRLIALRQHDASLRRGNLELLAPENSRILAFTREYEGECILVVTNLSRFVQYVELDLSRFAGRRLVEMFGQSRFPVIGKVPYALSLAPHAFYWFAVESEASAATSSATGDVALAKITLPAGWEGLGSGRTKKSFAALMLRSLPQRPWFDAKGRTIQNVQVFDVIALDRSNHPQGPCLVLCYAWNIWRENRKAICCRSELPGGRTPRI